MGEEDIRGEVHHQELGGSSGGGSSSSSSAPSAEEEVVITIEKPWIKSLEKTLINGFSSSCQDNSSRTDPKDFPTIFKVPEYIRCHDPKAYEPKLVSLGPYHHHDQHLQSLDNLKLYLLDKFLSRNPIYSLADYIEMIREREREARDAYSEQVSMSSDYFVRMMLLDCCFVLEIIVRIIEQYNMITWEEDELAELVSYPIISTLDFQLELAQDMLLLENQLPFFLLQLLFGCAHEPTEKDAFLKLVLGFSASSTGWAVNTLFSGEKQIHHFLHLLHSSTAPPAPWGPPKILPKRGRIIAKHYSSFALSQKLRQFSFLKFETKTKVFFPSAVQLKEGAGVHFEKKRLNRWESFLCITLDRGRMRIPTLIVNGQTNVLFRNLIALEQCYFKRHKLSRDPNMSIENNYFTAYVSLMDCIIKTKADVNLLKEKEIIFDGFRDDKEVACLFNHLCKGVIVDDERSYLSNVFKSLHKHWNNECNKTMANLRQKYWGSPWAPFSLFGALVLFLLAAGQTIYTILSYYQRK